jgi:hypothetical protein
VNAMKYSIIILLEIENPEFVEFVMSVHSLFSELGDSFEILIIRNGVGTLSEKEKDVLTHANPVVRMFQMPAKTTEALCLTAGFKESRGEILVVFGSFQQITNKSLKTIIGAMDDSIDIISPWRQNRVDNFFNQMQSKTFNWLVKSIARSEMHDLGCKVKILRRQILDSVAIYGNMFNFLPILAREKGFQVKEIKCDHYKDHGKSGLYSLSRYLTILLDIFTLYFNSRFTRKPLRFFSAIGVVFFLLGALILSYVFIEKFLFGTPIGERAVLLLSLLFTVIGIQAASVGLLGEIIAFVHGRHRKEYTIEKII